MRLLRGESLDALARESGQPAGRIASWREEFLAAGREGLKSRGAPVEDRRLAEAQCKVGELSMEIEFCGRSAKRWTASRGRSAGSPASCRIPLDLTIVDEWARLRVLSKQNGWNLGDNDLWITATASARGHALVTCDADQARIVDPGLEVLHLPAPQ